MGADRDLHWSFSPRQVDFYDIKGFIEDLFEIFQIREVKFNKVEGIPYLHPGRAAVVTVGKEVLGVLGEGHPEVISHYEFIGKVCLFEINFEKMVKFAKEERKFQLLPKFPSVYRDLSIVVDEGLEAEQLREVILNLQQPFLEEINLFDVYRGAPIIKGKKSISYRIRYQAHDRTLTDEEVNQYHEKMISHLREVFKAELRV
jgi:phenylalanyl-tRNA synthetase beta chain